MTLSIIAAALLAFVVISVIMIRNDGSTTGATPGDATTVTQARPAHPASR